MVTEREGSNQPATRLAVVGAGGFLGRSLVEHARATGHSILEFEVDSPPVRDGALAPGLLDVGVVYWLASRCNPATAESHPDWALAELSEFRAFLDLVHRLPHVPRVVLASSGGAIYGNGRPPFREDAALAPIGAYGASKRDAEKALWSSGVPGAAVRISNPYGPGQRPGTGQGVVAQWLDDISHDRTPVLIGSPETARDYIYVADVAYGLVKLGRSDVTGPVNLGDGQATTLEELAHTIEQVTGTSVHFKQAPARPFDVSAVWLDITRARRELDWEPQTSLRGGLTKTWAQLQAHQD